MSEIAARTKRAVLPGWASVSTRIVAGARASDAQRILRAIKAGVA
jgi:hypothetical protein